VELIQAVVERLVAASELITLLGAYWVVVVLAERQAATQGLAPARVSAATTWFAVGGVVGGRLAYILPDWRDYVGRPFDLLLIQSGLSFYGALAGAVVVAGWYAWRAELPLGRTLDLFAPCMALGIAVYRLACIIRGDCYGAPASSPWGVVFPGFSQPRYPAEIYEGLLALFLFAVLWVWRDRRRFSGEVGLLFLIIYPLLRAWVDLFRINLGGWPTADQLISLVVSVMACIVWLWRSRTSTSSIVVVAARHQVDAPVAQEDR
jgi:phosphatidylglycerol---prolipoprotein diacylglyceryl transferase